MFASRIVLRNRLQGQADHGELGVPVGPGRSRQQRRRRVGDPRHAQLEQVMAQAPLERDHAQAVHDRLGRILVGQMPDNEVREVEAEPDAQL
jgi:hypothetical protein